MIYEPKMTITHDCGNVVEYYLSEVMTTDSKKISCNKCKKEIQLPFPNYMAVEMRGGRPMMKIDLSLVLTESALHDSLELLSSWVSFMEHLTYPMTKSKNKCSEKLPEQYKQEWWSK